MAKLLSQFKLSAKAERDYLGRKIKAQFKSADTFKAKTVITLGESEVESGQVNVKNNATREEVTVSFEELTKNFAAVLEQLEKQGAYGQYS